MLLETATLAARAGDRRRALQALNRLKRDKEVPQETLIRMASVARIAGDRELTVDLLASALPWIRDRNEIRTMAELYANRGPYGFAFRTNYMRVSSERVSDGLINTRLEMNMTMGVNDYLASFRVHDNVRLVTGVRQVFAKLDLDIETSAGGIVII